MEASVLRGDRVELRPFERRDLPRMRAFFRDPELAWLDSSTPEAYAATDVDALFRRWTGAWTRDEPDLAAFALDVDGVYVGHASLSHLGHPHRSFELGVVIGDPGYRRRGIGREVVRLLLGHGFGALRARRIHLTTHERNPAALRCYLACGFVEEGRPRRAAFVEGAYVDQIEMSILREEYEEHEPHEPHEPHEERLATR